MVEEAVKLAVLSRAQNSGQTCTAGKRFIIHESLYDKFINLLVENLDKVVVGDPFEKGTQMGPLARQDLLDAVEDQV